MTAFPSYLFGVSQFTTYPWTFEQDIEGYTRLGVQAIEICEFKLDDERAPEQLRMPAARGLRVGSVQPQVRTLLPSKTQPEPRDVPSRMARFRQSIARCEPLGKGVPFVTNTGIPPNGNIQHVVEMAVREYRALADYAAGFEARIALEPLNPSIMNEESAIWTIHQAMRIVTAVDRNNFGICLDTWNIWQNADVEQQIRACGDRIFVVQVSDWRTPRSFQDRLVPGKGSIPLPPLLRAVYDGGFRGPLSVEIFSAEVPDALWQSDLQEVIVQSKAGLDGAWRAAFEARPAGSGEKV